MKKTALLIFTMLVMTHGAFCATLEEFYILIQATQNIESLRKNILDNAAGYKTDTTSGRIDVPTCIQIMKDDAIQYNRRLKWLTDIEADNSRRQKLANALQAIGEDFISLDASLLELQNATNLIKNAVLETKTDIDSVSDQIILSLPPHDQVFKP